MGQYNEVISGIGKNKAEALRKAKEEYIHENGHRCSFRDMIEAKLVKKVPPQKMNVQTGYQVDAYGRKRPVAIHSMLPDPTAPQSEWQELWEFEIWVHS